MNQRDELDRWIKTKIAERFGCCQCCEASHIAEFAYELLGHEHEIMRARLRAYAKYVMAPYDTAAKVAEDSLWIVVLNDKGLKQKFGLDMATEQ